MIVHFRSSFSRRMERLDVDRHGLPILPVDRGRRYRTFARQADGGGDPAPRLVRTGVTADRDSVCARIAGLRLSIQPVYTALARRPAAHCHLLPDRLSHLPDHGGTGPT